VVPNLSNVRSAFAGSVHACAVLGDSTLRCWGNNGSGRLGDGTTISRPRFVRVRDLFGVVTGAAGNAHSCALLTDDSVRCWGANGRGQLGDGTLQDRNTANLNVVGVDMAVGIGVGGSSGCAVLRSGGAVCWGANDFGQLGDGGRADRGLPGLVRGLTGAAQIAVGGRHACVIARSGAVKCWGANDRGQLGDGSTETRLIPVPVQGLGGRLAVDVALGRDHSCVILDDASARCWGANTEGQLGNGATMDSATPTPVRRQ
jgi:alpha-tubulin suppressor-like RCC1 family protein